MADTGEVIIKGGGSVEVTFDSSEYTPTENPSRLRHDTKNMTRVRVIDEDGTTVLFDSGEKERVLALEVRVQTRP